MPDTECPFAVCLNSSIAAILKEKGFQNIEENALESLRKTLINYMKEIGQRSRALAEVGGRTDIVPSDVTLALLNMGYPIYTLTTALRDACRTSVQPPETEAGPSWNASLKVGRSRPKPSYIPDHLPPFPDPHTYTNTECVVQASDHYSVVRERAAKQKTDAELCLVSYLTSTNPCDTLVVAQEEIKVVIPKPLAQPYLNALLPSQTTVDEAPMEAEPVNMQSESNKQIVSNIRKKNREKKMHKQQLRTLKSSAVGRPPGVGSVKAGKS